MPSNMSAEAIIDLLSLSPLPAEGGHYRRTYVTGDPEKPDSSAIYYLITPGTFSALHRLGHDELFHFYGGDPCEMIQIDQDGTLKEFRLGMDLESGERPQILTPAHCWQGTKLCTGGSWSLMGTTMSPGFTETSFELARDVDIGSFAEDVIARSRQFFAP